MKRLILCISVIALATMSLGQGFSKRVTTIKVAKALIESDAAGLVLNNREPHVWYNLDSNSKIKPPGFNFANPFPRASSKKFEADYWTLRLSTASDSQLASLDVILLAAHGPVNLNTAEREKLRRFVEKGGVLWVDVNSFTAMEPWNGLPYPFTITTAVGGPGAYTDFNSFLLNYPNPITEFDLIQMQADPTASLRDLNLAALGFGAIASIGEPLGTDSTRFDIIASDNKGSYVSLGRIGDGYLLVTSKGLATTLNRIPVSGGYNNNVGATGLKPEFDRSSDAAGKLIINLIYQTAGYDGALKGARKGGSTRLDFGAPMLQSFADVSKPPYSSPFDYRPPAVFKGLMIMPVNDGIAVYDADPRKDLDGDGDPDDGIRDYATGAGYDLVWVSRVLPGPVSSPIGIEVPNAGAGITRDQIVVCDATGTVHSFEAFPYNANGIIQGLTAATPLYSISCDTGPADLDTSFPGHGIYAPTFHEGYLFMADSQNNGLGRSGRIWVANPATGLQVTTNGVGWSMGGSAASGAIADISFSPTVGYIPIADNSGGLDKVIYVPTRPNPSGGPQASAGLSSIWFGAKGEKPASAPVDSAAALQVQTRASSQGLTIYKPTTGTDDLGLGVKLTILKPNGDPYTAAEMDATFTGAYAESNGVLTFTKKVAAPAFPVGFGVRVDYTIDYGTGIPGMASQIVRGNITLPDDTGKDRRILHGIALSPKGTMHLVVSSQDPTIKAGGSYYAIREEGRGNFKVVNRFTLFPQHILTLNQANDVNYPETLQNTDPLLGFVPPFVQALLGGRIPLQTFVSGPVISGDQVLVSAKGLKPFVPMLFTMAFKTEPDPIKIIVPSLASGFAILQPDLDRSTSGPGGRPDVFSVLQPNQYVYEENNGVGTIRIDNLSATTRGPLTNVLSTSQPVILRQNTQQDTLLEPSARGSWNQLNWYALWLGSDSTSPMFASGNTAFMATASSWASILTLGTFAPAGQVYAMETNISPNDKFLGTSDPNRPWLKQLYMVTGSPMTTFDANPAVKWPSFQGITSFGDYQTRLQQTILRIPDSGGFASPSMGAIGGLGSVFAWSPEGIWAFNKADFLVADEARVARFDQIGTPIWSLDATFKTGSQGDTGGAGQVTKLVRPTKVYGLSDRQVLIVDTGASRVIKADVSGKELRSVSGFKLDATYVPDSYASNESKSLTNPRDAMTFTTIVAAGNNPFSNPQALEYWVHYAIADTGNQRIIELVDRYAYVNNRVGSILSDSNGERAVGVLYWHSAAKHSGAGYDYTSIDRVFIDAGVNSRYIYAAGIGNQLPARADIGLDTPATAAIRRSDEGNGGIVIFDGATSTVINEVDVPALPANVYWDANTNSFNSPAEPARRKRLGSLNSIDLHYHLEGGVVHLDVMVTDSEGVFDITDGGGGTWNVEWMLTRKAYPAMRRNGVAISYQDNPADFMPTYAKRLDSGEVLICNGYTGYYRRNLATDPRVRFTGEVILVDGDFDPSGVAPLGFDFNKPNLGFQTTSIRAVLNNKPGGTYDARGIIGPVFADKQ
ncbi:MAG: hypothetical protein ABL949_09285 [Fimbriimonadaceae bacterium]